MTASGRTRRLTLAQQALVEDARTQRMARRVVAIFMSLHPTADRAEYAALAQEALVLSAPLFDPGRNVSFAAFAARRVHGHLYRALYRDWLQQAASGRALLKYPALPPPDASAAAHSTPEENLKAERRWLLARGLAQVLLSLRHAHGHSPEEELRRARLFHAVDQARRALPVDHERIITLHYFEDIPLTRLANEFQMSSSALSRLHQDALVRLRHELTRHGFGTLPGDLLD